MLEDAGAVFLLESVVDGQLLSAVVDEACVQSRDLLEAGEPQ